MSELPVLASGFLVGITAIGAGLFVQRSPFLYRIFTGTLHFAAALGGYFFAEAVSAPGSVLQSLATGIFTGVAVLGGIQVSRLLDLYFFSSDPTEPDSSDPAEARRFRIGLFIMLTLSWVGGFHLSGLVSHAGAGAGASPVAAALSAGWDALRGLGNEAGTKILIAIVLLALLIAFLRWRSDADSFEERLWPSALAAGLAGAIVGGLVTGGDSLSFPDIELRSLGAAGAVLLLGLFLLSLLRGDRPGFDSYSGGLGDGLAGWRITPSLAYLLGALALAAVLLVEPKDDAEKPVEPETGLTSEEPEDDAGDDSDDTLTLDLGTE